MNAQREDDDGFDDNVNKHAQEIQNMLSQQTEDTTQFTLRNNVSSDEHQAAVHDDSNHRGNIMVRGQPSGNLEEHKSGLAISHHDGDHLSENESSQFRPGQMIDLWKNLQDLLKNQCKEEIQVVRERNKKLQQQRTKIHQVSDDQFAKSNRFFCVIGHITEARFG